MSFCFSPSQLYVSTHLGKNEMTNNWLSWVNLPMKIKWYKNGFKLYFRETEIPVIFNEKINGISSHNSRASLERRLLFNSRNWKPQLLRSWKGNKMWWTYLHKDVGKKQHGQWWIMKYAKTWLIDLLEWLFFSVVPHVNGYNSARTSWDYQSWQVTQNEAPI